MCEAPIDEELDGDGDVWKKTSRIGEDEGAVARPNVKTSLF